MEDNEEFNKVVENITQLEQQLMAIDIKRYEQEGEEAEREIEGHFARCMNDLAARKEALLGDLNKHISHQSMPSIYPFSCLLCLSSIFISLLKLLPHLPILL